MDKETHEKYIGKKHFAGQGKKNRGTPSNWRSYTSSSNEVNSRIAKFGRDRFHFIVLEQYSTAGGLSFAETWSQVVCEVPSKNNEFINRFIDKVTWRVTEPVTPQHRKRLEFWMNRFPFPKTSPVSSSAASQVD